MESGNAVDLEEEVLDIEGRTEDLFAPNSGPNRSLSGGNLPAHVFRSGREQSQQLSSPTPFILSLLGDGRQIFDVLSRSLPISPDMT